MPRFAKPGRAVNVKRTAVILGAVGILAAISYEPETEVSYALEEAEIAEVTDAVREVLGTEIAVEVEAALRDEFQ